MRTTVDTGIGENAQNLRTAYEQLRNKKRADHKGQIFVFSAAQSGCGTSYVARNMALVAGQNLLEGEQVLLVDMDVQKNAQSDYFATPEAAHRYGETTGPYDASFQCDPFWKITPSVVGDPERMTSNAQYMSLHMLGHTPLSFTRFHWEYFKQGQNVHIQNARAYWHALRDHFAVVIVDTPAMDRSHIHDTICPEADANILVSSHVDARSQALSNAATDLKKMGAQFSGVILNHMPSSAQHYGEYI